MSSKSVQDFAGKPAIMGIVNVTPDSFSDGGEFFNKNNAVDHGVRLMLEGAHILDVGGESTRPGAQVIEIQEEIDRVVPVVEALVNEGALVSVDTRNAATMREVLKVGAWAINDISGLGYDSESVFVVKEYQCPVFLMHMQGDPQSMQQNPNYNNVIDDIYSYLSNRIKFCETHSIEKEKIVIDIGLGFGKSLEHNLLLLRNIKRFHDLGCAQLLGASRKSFIEKISGEKDAKERLGGSLAAAVWGLSQGVQFFRVHDVKETIQAFEIYQAITSV